MAPSKTKLSQSRKGLEVINKYILVSVVSFRVLHFCSFAISATCIIICKVIEFFYSTELSFVLENIFINKEDLLFLRIQKIF